MKYTELEILNTLVYKDRVLKDYVVVLGKDGVEDMLYFISHNVLFIDIIEDDELYIQCVDYIKKHGVVYESREQLREKRPEIISFGK